MATGSKPVREVAKHALGDFHPLAPRYPRYGLLPGGSGADRERSSLILEDFSLSVTGVTCVTR